jgi:2,3-diketo-5-methylthiopentyl-1-phosphate enolase
VLEHITHIIPSNKKMFSRGTGFMNETDVLSLPISLPEGVDYEDYVVVTYLASFPPDVPVPKLAPAPAIEQSTGTWLPVPGETPEVRRRHIAKVVGIYEVPDFEFSVPPRVETRNYIVQIAFPETNIGE